MEMHPSIQDCVQVILRAQDVQVNNYIPKAVDPSQVCDHESFTFRVTARRMRVLGKTRHSMRDWMIFQGKKVETGQSLELKMVVEHQLTVLVPRNQTVKLQFKRKSATSHEFLFEPVDRCLSIEEVPLKLSETSAEFVHNWEREQIRRVWVSAVMLPDDQFRPYLAETDEKLITGFRKNLLVTLVNLKLSDVTINFL